MKPIIAGHDVLETAWIRVVASSVLLLAVASTPALAHGKLEDASPSAGAVLDAPPTEVRVRFNEPLEPEFSALKLIGGDRAAVTAVKATVPSGDARTMSLAVPKLAPGMYEVQWVAVGHDGHRVKGAYSFSVK